MTRQKSELAEPKPEGKHAAVHPSPPPSFNTREEWLEYVYAPPYERPELPTAKQLAAMSALERKRLDQQRRHHHRSLGELSEFDTPELKRVHGELWELIELNSNARSARFHHLLSGDPMLGKTTIVRSFAKKYERSVSAVYSSGRTATGDELIPVVYCSVGGESTIKTLNRDIARFCNLPTNGRSKDDLTRMIQKLARRCCTTLFVIDDIHHLDERYGDHRRLNDHFKHLMSTIAATFSFAGVNADEGPLLRADAGPSFWATQRRITLYNLKPYGFANAKQRKQWLDLLAQIEDELLLLASEPGMLQKLAQDLHDDSGGEIGSLMELIRLAALRAMRSGTEKIDEALLAEVKINYGREQHRRARRSA